MEAHQLIRTWLDSRQDYAQGLALARDHGVAGFTLTLLESGQNTFTQGKLREALQERLDQLSTQANAPTVQLRATPAPAAVATVASVAAAPETPELLAVRARRILSFKQAGFHFGKMRHATPGPQRKAHAKAIKQLMRENASLWAQEEYYKQFGFLPPVQELPDLDRTDLRAVERRRNTLRTYLSHAGKGKRAKADTTKVASWTAELQELDLVLQHG